MMKAPPESQRHVNLSFFLPSLFNKDYKMYH